MTEEKGGIGEQFSRTYGVRFGVFLISLMPLVGLTNVWELGNVAGLSLRGGDLLFVATLGTWIFNLLINQIVKLRAISLVGLIAALLTVAIFGEVFLPGYKSEWAGLFRFFQTVMWGVFALTFVRGVGGIFLIARNIVIAGSLLSAFSVYLYLMYPGLHRIAGFFSAAGGEGLDHQASYNEIGALYAFGTLISLVYLIWHKNVLLFRDRVVMWVGLVSTIVGLVLVQSRSAMLAFCLGIAILVGPYIKRVLVFGVFHKKLIGLFGIGSFFLLAIALGSVFLVNVDRLSSTFAVGSSEYYSAMNRIEFWGRAVNVWFDSVPGFLFGFGFGSPSRLLGVESAHNFFLNLALWFGVVGLLMGSLLLIWPVFGLIRAIHKRNVYDCRSGGLCLRVSIAAFSVAIGVSVTGNTIVNPLYGGCTFLMLYGAYAAKLAQNRFGKEMG